ncbi:MAG: GAF domain-containing protein [Anaerolineae bacterium]|nr:GAF domain-containing protein [Anaerolineae bacterium]
MIFLITNHDTLLDTFTDALSTPVAVTSFSTITEAQAYWSASSECFTSQDIIIIDATETPEYVADIYNTYQQQRSQSIPLIAIISHPAHRETVLKAGADDYLLWPLIREEVQSRLSSYLNYAVHGFDHLLKIIAQLGSGGSPYSLNKSMRGLAKAFDANSAWLLLPKATNRAEFEIVSHFNLPPLFKEDHTLAIKEVQKYGGTFDQTLAFPQVVQSMTLMDADAEMSTGLCHHLIVPLKSENELMGILTLAYTDPPVISEIEKKNLAILGRHIGTLFNILHRQEETQVHAMQNALLVLITRLADEQSDLYSTLSLMLELATPLFNASRSHIWLVSDNKKDLDLVASLSNRFSNPALSRRKREQGLIGWVAEHKQPLLIDVVTEDDRFDSEADNVDNIECYSLLAVPLYHRDDTLGVLALYNDDQIAFNEQDLILLEGVAALLASIVANRQLLQELRDYAAQQRALYEMSQQIAVGLDLESTLNRTLYWSSRLVETEVSLLWMSEPTPPRKAEAQPLRLVATLGFKQQDNPMYHNLEKSLAAQVIQQGQPIIINDPLELNDFDSEIYRAWDINLRNIISLPINYHGDIIGAISLINKVGGPFNEADSTLLSTAVEIIAVAVGNAQLHQQTIDLMEDRTRLHTQMTQTERLVTVGRLTASISHEINNPMQTIQGALTLALEELNDPEELSNYIQMSLNETKRVVQLVSRMRQIYRPQTEKPRSLDINVLLQDAVVIGQRELKRKKVSLELELANNLPTTIAIGHQLRLVFVNLILNLSDAISKSGKGVLRLRSRVLPDIIRIEFCTDTDSVDIANWVSVLQLEPKQKMAEVSFGASMSYDIVAAHNGSIYFRQRDQEVIWFIEIPLTSSNNHLN